MDAPRQGDLSASVPRSSAATQYAVTGRTHAHRHGFCAFSSPGVHADSKEGAGGT